VGGSTEILRDVRYGLGVSAALSFLALHSDEQWPFEQLRKALADAGMGGPKPEARWQLLDASLNGIKRVIRSWRGRLYAHYRA
jgi:hypothetical protein